MAVKSLSTLIRLQKQRLDALRRRLSTLQEQRAKLERQDAALVAELEAELKLAEGAMEMSGFFGDFAKRIRNRRAELAGEMKKLDQHIHAATEQIRDAFSEMKKYEIALENRKKAAQAEHHRKDISRLDEAAARGHARKQEE